MLKKRQDELKRSIKYLETLVQAAERGDPDVRRLQLFGGNAEKERIFKENLEQVKERFLHTMYNITAKREKILFILPLTMS